MNTTAGPRIIRVEEIPSEERGKGRSCEPTVVHYFLLPSVAHAILVAFELPYPFLLRDPDSGHD